MVVMSIHQTERGDYCFQAYGVSLVYDQRQETVFCYMDSETRQEITHQFPEKPTLEEFDWFARKYIASVSFSKAEAYI